MSPVWLKTTTWISLPSPSRHPQTSSGEGASSPLLFTISLLGFSTFPLPLAVHLLVLPRLEEMARRDRERGTQVWPDGRYCNPVLVTPAWQIHQSCLFLNWGLLWGFCPQIYPCFDIGKSLPRWLLSPTTPDLVSSGISTRAALAWGISHICGCSQCLLQVQVQRTVNLRSF